MQLKEIRKVLGTRIREERLKRKFTIEELSEMIDLSPSYLGLVERGERSLGIKKLYVISKTLGVSIDSLVNNEGQYPTSKKDELKALLRGLTDDEARLIVDTVKFLKKKLKSIRNINEKE